jgi:peroxiredoxin
LREDNERFSELGARVLAVAPDGVDAVVRFTKDNSFPFRIVSDADHSAFDAYDVASRAFSLGQRPAVFVIDTDGTVRFDSVGTQQWQIPTNDAVLDVVRGLAR